MGSEESFSELMRDVQEGYGEGPAQMRFPLPGVQISFDGVGLDFVEEVRVGTGTQGQIDPSTVEDLDTEHRVRVIETGE